MLWPLLQAVLAFLHEWLGFRSVRMEVFLKPTFRNCTASFTPHPIGQKQITRQLRFRGWGNEHFLMGIAANNLWSCLIYNSGHCSSLSPPPTFLFPSSSSSLLSSLPLFPLNEGSLWVVVFCGVFFCLDLSFFLKFMLEQNLLD